MNGRIHHLYENGLVGESIRYVIASIFSASLSLSLPMFFHEGVGLSEELAVGISLTAVFVINFFILRMYVYQSKESRHKQIWKFAFSSAAFRTGEYLAFLLIYSVSSIHYIIALMLVLAPSFLAKFFVQRTFVFLKR